jgi:predicted transcriptional regulator
MKKTLSIRIDAVASHGLDTPSKQSERSMPILAAEAKAAEMELEEWQFGEIRTALAELDAGHELSHRRVSKWLHSWGMQSERKAPR